MPEAQLAAHHFSAPASCGSAVIASKWMPSKISLLDVPWALLHATAPQALFERCTSYDLDARPTFHEVWRGG